jgi:hypothetical protein
VRGDQVGLAVAVEVAERHVLVVAACQVALVVAAAGAAAVGREADHLAAVAAPRVHHVGGSAVARRGREVEAAVAVDVTGGEAAQLVLPRDREARQHGARGVEQGDLLARRERDLELGVADKIADHRARPDPSGRGHLPQHAAVRPPRDQGLAARDHDLHRAVAVEIGDRRRAEPRLLVAVLEDHQQLGRADRRAPAGRLAGRGRRLTSVGGRAARDRRSDLRSGPCWGRRSDLRSSRWSDRSSDRWDLRLDLRSGRRSWVRSSVRPDLRPSTRPCSRPRRHRRPASSPTRTNPRSPAAA